MPDLEKSSWAEDKTAWEQLAKAEINNQKPHTMASRHCWCPESQRGLRTRRRRRRRIECNRCSLYSKWFNGSDKSQWRHYLLIVKAFHKRSWRKMASSFFYSRKINNILESNSCGCVWCVVTEIEARYFVLFKFIIKSRHL